MNVKVERWVLIAVTAVVMLALTLDFVEDRTFFFQRGGTLSTILIAAGAIMLVMAWVDHVRKGKK